MTKTEILNTVPRFWANNPEAKTQLQSIITSQPQINQEFRDDPRTFRDTPENWTHQGMTEQANVNLERLRNKYRNQ